MATFVYITIAILLISAAECRDGFATVPYTDPSPTQWQCLTEFGNNVVLPVWFGDDGVEFDCAPNARGALDAGLSVDLYAAIGPLQAKNANVTLIVDQIVAYTQENKVKLTKLYLMVLYDDTWWDADQKANIKYLADGVAYILSQNISAGVYCEKNDWEKAFGDEWDDRLAPALVWYLDQDGATNFNDWRSESFGQWTSPSMKTYNSDSVCDGIAIMYNWFT